jgi:uncharacterized protein (UPF0332 family)
MTLIHSYQRIARRSLSASDALLNNSIQEKATFMTYHAFESTGCALSLSDNLPVGSGVKHSVKIDLFKKAARRLGNGKVVDTLAIELRSLRNDLLYPKIDSKKQTITLPENVINLTDAKTLKKRVQGIVNWVDTKI